MRFVMVVVCVLIHAAVVDANEWNPSDSWQIGSSWQLNTQVRDMDGEWSEPEENLFAVQDVGSVDVTIKVDSKSGNSALISISRTDPQLKRIELADTFKGEVLRRILRIDGRTPVYPQFSTLPLFLAILSEPVEASCAYPSIRYLNDRRIGQETLLQHTETITIEALMAILPQGAVADVKALIDGISSETDIFAYTVEKDGALIFRQFWIDGLSWAVYTEGPTCRAWMNGMTR